MIFVSGHETLAEFYYCFNLSKYIVLCPTLTQILISANFVRCELDKLRSSIFAELTLDPAQLSFERTKSLESLDTNNNSGTFFSILIILI